MRLVILESPYSGKVQRNLLYARRAIRDCMLRNESPIASHLLYTQPGILSDAHPIERIFGIEAGHAWYRVADLIVFYTDYGNSRGMEAARRLAKTLRVKTEDRTIGLNPQKVKA